MLTEEHFDLLLSIAELGSLMASAGRMGISYRKAWGLLRDSEKTLGLQLIEKHRGGRDGGKSVLTPDGASLVEAYRKLRSGFDASVKLLVKDFFRTINE